MLIITVFLSVSIAVVTAIAGFRTTIQVRQSAGVSASAKAIFAADAGLEWGLCAVVHPVGGAPCPLNPDPLECPTSSPGFIYNPNVTVAVNLTCVGATPRKLTATGRAGTAVRVLELDFTP